MERRIVAQLLTCLDELAWEKNEGRPVMVLGATNRPDAIDPALRRAGRFDHEIALGVPDEQGREQILQVLCAKMRLAGDFNVKYLAKRTPGYVGADLTSLTAAAGIIAVKRIFQHLRDADDAMQCEEPPQETTSDETHIVTGPAFLEGLPESVQSSSIAMFLKRFPHPLPDAQLEQLSLIHI